MFMGRDRWWELAASICRSTRTSSASPAIDLAGGAGGKDDTAAADEGRALLRRLVEWADVVVENYTPRVLEKWGLGWETVHAINPSAVMMRMPAFGLDGPWRGRLGFAQTVEQMSGMAWVTGYADGEPLVPRGPCDPIGGHARGFAVLVALAARDADRGGTARRGAATRQRVEHDGRAGHRIHRHRDGPGPGGNRSPSAAPQGLYACHQPEEMGTGQEQWLALSVADDEQWQALVKVLGSPTWALDPQLGTHAGRREAGDELDARLGAWARGRDLAATVELLLAGGVPAAKLTSPRELLSNPHMVSRGYLEDVTNTVVGTHPVPGACPCGCRG